MLAHLAKEDKDTYVQVAKRRKLSIKSSGMNTYESVAMARVGNLNDSRFSKLRSFAKNIGGFELEHKAAELSKLGEEAGVGRTKEATFGTCSHEWANTKGKEKKEPENVEHWNSSLMAEVEAEVDMHLSKRFLANDVASQKNPKNNDQEVPSLDYKGDGFEFPGVTILIGGDHGDKNCPISCKINLSNPQERKRRGDLNLDCPMVQFASVKCSKDACDLMDNTIMPKVKEEVKLLQKSAIVTVHHKSNVSGCFQSFSVPIDVNERTIATRRDGDVTSLHFGHGSADSTVHGSIHCQLSDKLNKVPFWELGWKVTVSRFNELFIGDLAFLAMLIGMNNSERYHCLLCVLKGNEFNCEHTLTERTLENLEECLEEFLLQVRENAEKGNKKKIANWFGVNGKGLLENIDPRRIVIPILHCPMGLVDKILESFTFWCNAQVERLDADAETATKLCLLSIKKVQELETTVKEIEGILKNNSENKEAKQQLKENKSLLAKARKVRTKAKEKYEDLTSKHNARKKSLKQKIEGAFRKNGISGEHHHGGKFNGVNCIRIVSAAKEPFVGDYQDAGGFLQHLLEHKRPDVTSASVKQKCQDYARLMGLMDAIWSKVRGIESGLLPADEQIAQLDKAIKEGKRQWLHMKLTTLQPKWHLTFDGHLIDQVKKYGGLADKADDSIEAYHQMLKNLRARYRGVRSYKTQENCIRRELRRAKSPKVQSYIDKYQSKIKKSVTSKRAVAAREKADDNKRIKMEKREGYINNNKVVD